MSRTYQTRIEVSAEIEHLLDQYAELYNTAERHLFAETLVQGIAPESVKSAYQIRYGITARQFNAICRNLKGKAKSVTELRQLHLEEGKARIGKAEKVIKSLRKKLTSHQKQLATLRKRKKSTEETLQKQKDACAAIDKLKHKLHHKTRRLVSLQDRQQRRQEDADAGKVRLCFGSRKLFHAQFHLAANGYDNHAQWQADWQARRNNQFYVLGSKDETAGCQGCVARPSADGFELHLRLPDALAPVTHVTLFASFAYGAEVIRCALASKQAIGYRFLKDAKGWRVLVSTDAPVVTQVSRRHRGSIGIDINANHLAVCETDRFGNPVDTVSIPWLTANLTSDQAAAVTGETVKSLLAFAKNKHKPLVLEKLDFTKKKAALEKVHPAYARMLSAFAYAAVQQLIQARAADAGIEVSFVHPAFTSVIGRHKFAARYGLSGHQAAACVIARRADRFSERPNRRDHNAQFLPERNRNRHVWSYWGKVHRKEAALKAPVPSTTAVDPRCRPRDVTRDPNGAVPVETRFASQEHCSPGVAENPSRDIMP
jgi:IS605 OrfB family transposase